MLLTTKVEMTRARIARRNKTGWVHIKLDQGVWYAYGSGPKWARNLLLVPAINFCKRLNDKRSRLAAKVNTR